MNFLKKSLALLLTAIMLVSAIPLGVFAAGETGDAKSTAAVEDYYWKLDFNKSTVGSTGTAFNLAKADSNYSPYGFGVNSGINYATVKQKTVGDNYVSVAYPVNGSKGGWNGAQIKIGKSGNSAAVFNTFSFEVDFRWQGMETDTGVYKYNNANVDIVKMRRYDNTPSVLLTSRENSNGDLDLYLKGYSADKYIYTLKKGAENFTNIKLVVYDVTQTFSLYIDDVLYAEQVVITTETNKDYRVSKYTSLAFDPADMLATKREQAVAGNTNDYVNFEFMRVSYPNSTVTGTDGVGYYTSTPVKFDFDNLYIKNYDLKEGITPYYENSFEGTKWVGLVDKTTASSYSFSNSSKVTKATYNGNSYVNVEPTGRFNIRDMYQFAQDGNYVVEFDLRATSADENRLMVLHTGSITKNLLTVDEEGYIYLVGIKTKAKVVAHKDADGNLINQDKWTHVALSVTVDKGGSNAGRVSDFTSYNSTFPLRLQFALYVDGALAGVYGEVQRLEYLHAGTTDHPNQFKRIDDKYFDKIGLTAKPDESALSGFTKLSYTGSRTVGDVKHTIHYYENTSTNDMYQLEYDANGEFVPGSVSNGTGSGSLHLKYLSTSNDDVIGFFNNNDAATTSGNISGALDNLKIYSGVIPLDYASAKSESSGVLAEFDPTKFFSYEYGDSKHGCAMLNFKGGDAGVALLGEWRKSRVTDNEGYSTYTLSNNGEYYFDLFTQYAGGKVFSIEATLRNFVANGAFDFFKLRRQAAGGSNKTAVLLYVDDGGALSYKVGSDKFILCDENGTPYDVRKNEWITPEVIVDESGTKAVLTYLVNGNVAYSIPDGAESGTQPTLAALVSGVYGSDFFNLRTAIDQRVRFFHTLSTYKFSADIKNLKVEYTTLPPELALYTGYYNVDSKDYVGELYSAKMTVSGFDKGYDVPLFTNIRQMTELTPEYEHETLMVEATTGYLYFEHDNGKKHYLVNDQRVRYAINGAGETELEVVFDERGSKILVTFLVDGKVAYYDNGEKLVSASNLHIGGDAVHSLSIGAVSKMRFYKIGVGEMASFADVTTAKLQNVESVPASTEIVWDDYLRVDFSNYTSIDQLLEAYGGQIEVTNGVTIQNGLLKIPAGGKIRWVDYNGNLTSYLAYDREAVNGQRLNGFNIEFIGNVNTVSGANARGLIQLDRAKMVDGVLTTTLLGDPLMFVVNQSPHLTGSTTQNYTLNRVGSDKYNTFAATFSNQNNEANIFVDGYLLGVARTTKFGNAEYANDKIVKVSVVGEAELKELRIHRTLERELATESGELFKLNADKMVIKYEGNTARWARPGVMDGALLADTTYTNQTTYSNAETGESFKYFKIAPTAPLSRHFFSTIWLNGYIEDKVTVFEYNFRFVPGTSSNVVEMCMLRRTEDGSSTGYGEGLFSITADSHYQVTGNAILCDENGVALVASSENWNKLAVIYDSDAGLVSYVLDGKIPYYYYPGKDEVKLAYNIQLPNHRYYRMDSPETQLRTISMATGSNHRLDLAEINIYTVEEDANAGYVGAQIDTSNNNIRLVAGTDMLYYGGVGFDVQAFDADGNPLSSTEKSYGTNIVYSSIKQTVDGEEKNVYPEDYGFRYFYTANIMNVSTEEAVRLHVTPYTVVNGVKYVAATTVLDVDFTAGTVANWTLDVPSIEVKPEGGNVNANFSLTDIVAYTNDGALEFNGLDASFGFAADLDGGVVTVNLTNALGEAATKTVFDVYVDGVLTQEALELPFGHHTLVLAEGLTGIHEFVLVKRSGGDFVCINSMGVCGTLTTPPALAKEGVVEVVVAAPASGADYGHVYVYVPTTDASGNYYARYNFTYLNYDVDSTWLDTDASNDRTYSVGKGNTPFNCHMYRIQAVDLYKKENGAFKASKEFGLLQTGEISVAMKEAVNGSGAVDFSGGYHGDENFVTLKFLLDGVELDTTKAGTYTGITTVEFIQDSIIDRCNETETPILYHKQHMLVDSNGLRIDRHLEVLADNFAPHHSNGYTMMATVYRIGPNSVPDAENVESTYNIKTLKVLNANGELADSSSVFDLTDGKYPYISNNESSVSCASDSSAVNRYAENTGDQGVYGRVGFVIDDASMQPKNVRVDVRLAHGDNKWYACVGSYQTSKNGDVVPKGEKWNLSTYYYVDYNSANITAEN